MRVVRCIKTIRNITQYTLNILSNTSTYSYINTHTHKDHPSHDYKMPSARSTKFYTLVYTRFVLYVCFGWMDGCFVSCTECIVYKFKQIICAQLNNSDYNDNDEDDEPGTNTLYKEETPSRNSTP